MSDSVVRTTIDYPFSMLDDIKKHVKSSDEYSSVAAFVRAAIKAKLGQGPINQNFGVPFEELKTWSKERLCARNKFINSPENMNNPTFQVERQFFNCQFNYQDYL